MCGEAAAVAMPSALLLWGLPWVFARLGLVISAPLCSAVDIFLCWIMLFYLNSMDKLNNVDQLWKNWNETQRNPPISLFRKLTKNSSGLCRTQAHRHACNTRWRYIRNVPVCRTWTLRSWDSEREKGVNVDIYTVLMNRKVISSWRGPRSSNFIGSCENEYDCCLGFICHKSNSLLSSLPSR